MPKTDIALDASFASLAAKNAPTEAAMKLTLSGEDMAQVITVEFQGTTTADWTPEAFDRTKAVALQDMTQEDQDALVSLAVVKGGLLFLPYINLPLVFTRALTLRGGLRH